MSLMLVTPLMLPKSILTTHSQKLPTLKVVKEKSIYKYQAPAQNIISPLASIIQASDFGVLKDCFEICIGKKNQDKATEEIKQEFMVCMNEQNLYKSLKEVRDDTYDKHLVTLQHSDRLQLRKAIMELPESNAFIRTVYSIRFV